MRPGDESFGIERPGLLAWPRGAFAALETRLAQERDRWFLWAVAAMASGIAVYFGWKSEPSLAIGIVACVAGLVSFASLPLLPHATSRFLLVLLAASLLGFSIAKLRTEWIRAPAIQSDVGAQTIAGRIVSVLPEDPKRARIVLEPVLMGTQTENLPKRLRFTLRGEKAVAAAQAGAWVSLLGALRPPPEPVVPNGYDFARTAYFQQLGGVGYTLGAPRPLTPPREETFLEAFRLRVEQLRLAMTAHIRGIIPGSDGAIAAALVTGERGGIAEEDTEAYRDSGLAHVLSISGLHMALAGFGIFFVFRALLALSARAALNFPIKKFAAFAALLSSTFYLFISGGGAAPMRSYLMLSAMLLAIMCDRPALTMRSVALAALAILLVAPESVTEAGFQMSFMAVIGLIALAEWHMAREKPEIPKSFGIFFLLRKARIAVTGVLLTTLIAGIATAPFAIYHFNRAAGFSLLANFLAFPVVGLIVMPFAAIGVILMPFGLDAWAFAIMGWGVGMMSDIARMVAELPNAAALVPSWPLAALLCMVGGFLWLGLWQGSWRFLGIPAVAAGLVLGMRAMPPDMLVSRDGSAAAVRAQNGQLVLLGKPDAYTAEQWLLRDGDPRTPEEALAGARCDENGCTAKDAKGRVVAFAFRAAAQADDCREAHILVSAVPVRRACARPAEVIDRFDVAREGAIALWFEDGVIRKETAREIRGVRPWTVR